MIVSQSDIASPLILCKEPAIAGARPARGRRGAAPGPRGGPGRGAAARAVCCVSAHSAERVAARQSGPAAARRAAGVISRPAVLRSL